MRGGWREVAFTADWDRVVMIHLEVDPGALADSVPFELDLWDGRAFVTLVAFTMCGMKPVLGGALGAWLFRPIATHRFLNVRTYVRNGGEVGIHFLAEWLSNGIAVRLGPPTFGLPYRHGDLEYVHGNDREVMTGEVVDRKTGCGLKYQARRDEHTAAGPCERGSLEEWLMERYTAYTVRRGVRGYFRVWHEPWRQVGLSVDFVKKDLLEANWSWMREAVVAGAQHSPGVKGVWMGWPR